MQSTNSIVKSFLKACYDLGNTPVWDPVKKASGKVKSQREKPKTEPTEKTTHFSLRGEIQPGRATKYSINGQDFEVLGSTWVVGVIEFGVIAKVKGNIKPGLGKCAREVVIEG